MSKPSVPSPPPGQKGKKIVERDTAALLRSTKTSPVVVERAEGSWLWGVDGEKYLDFTSGIGVVNTGHGHPKVVAAIREQAEKLVHFAGTDFYYEQQVALAEELLAITPGRFAKKVFYTNSGTESNEAAIKIARYHDPKRSKFVAFLGAFHGRTLGSLSLTASKPVHQEGFFPTLPGVFHVPYPDPYRNVWGIDGYEHPAELTKAAISFMEDHLFATRLPSSEVAAVFVEAVQGEGGYVVPPSDFLPELAKLCERHGILLALDEVQTGFGRTGKMFASEHTATEPDLLALAKGIASGLPMGAVVTRAELDFPKQGSHSNTFGGNPVCCAAARATIEVLKGGLVENSAKQGEYLHKRLRELQEKHDLIGDVRGLGLMQATEFVTDRRSKAFAVKERDRIVELAYKKGLVLLPCGKSGIRYIPPLSVSAEEIDAGVEIVEACLREVR